MDRRDFLKSTAAAVILPALPAGGNAEPVWFQIAHPVRAPCQFGGSVYFRTSLLVTFTTTPEDYRLPEGYESQDEPKVTLLEVRRATAKEGE